MEMLIPGATTTDSFTLPVDAGLIRSLRLDYCQNGSLLFRKTEKDCEINGISGAVELSQEDTLKFVDQYDGQVQIILVTTGDEVIPSEPVSFMVGTRLKREVL